MMFNFLNNTSFIRILLHFIRILMRCVSIGIIDNRHGIQRVKIYYEFVIKDITLKYTIFAKDAVFVTYF